MTTATRLTPSIDPNAYDRWRRRERGYGRWQPFVEAEPVRTHVRAVMTEGNIGWRRYAELAGVPRSTLAHILFGKKGQFSPQITTENARKLMALHADIVHGCTLPALGTQRRIQTLMAAGWPQIHMGPHFGTHPQYVGQILRLDRVTAATAQSVADAYPTLAAWDPLDHGVTPWGSRYARLIAGRAGWPGPDYWDPDDFDNPDFEPAAAEPDLGPRELSAERKREIEHLADYGVPARQIGNRLGAHLGGLSERYINDIVTEHRTGRKRDRRKPGPVAS